MCGDTSYEFIREYLVIGMGEECVDQVNSQIAGVRFYDSLTLKEKIAIESMLRERKKKKRIPSVGQFLKMKLHQQNLTQAELEKKTGIEKSYLSKVMSNSIKCEKYRLIKIALILNCTYSEILELLEVSGFTLDYSTKDQVIAVCLENGILRYSKVEDAVKKYAGEYIAS